MSRLFAFRLTLDVLAVSLLLAAYAYNGLGNTLHEIAGTALFTLLTAHNVFNRRWYGTIAKSRRDTRGTIAKVINLSLLGTMVSLMVTSVIISQTVFGFLPLTASFTMRQLHTLAAYGALMIVSLHLGLQWPMIMGLVQSRLKVTTGGLARVWALRLAAACVAAFGIHSLVALDVVSKLSMEIPTGFQAFEISTPALLLHHLAVVGLGICVVHTGLKAVRAMARI